MTHVRLPKAALAVLLLLAACDKPAAQAGATPSASSPAVSYLPEGPITPGTYRFPLDDLDTCDPALRCPVSSKPGPAPDIDLTVPEGWSGSNEFHLVTPTATDTDAPDGAALVLGWTSYGVALNADPCTPASVDGGHQVPTIDVGPTVDDFVDAVARHPKIVATTARPVTVGGYAGKYFSLKAPHDLGGCQNWRPWDPGFYAQGPDNTWDIWVMDVNGFRVMVVADHFPATSAKVRTQLRQMVSTLRFVPR
jgi:hypothetical protein